MVNGKRSGSDCDLIEVLSRHLPGGTDENQHQTQPSHPVSQSQVYERHRNLIARLPEMIKSCAADYLFVLSGTTKLRYRIENTSPLDPVLRNIPPVNKPPFSFADPIILPAAPIRYIATDVSPSRLQAKISYAFLFTPHVLHVPPILFSLFETP